MIMAKLIFLGLLTATTTAHNIFRSGLFPFQDESQYGLPREKIRDSGPPYLGLNKPYQAWRQPLLPFCARNQFRISPFPPNAMERFGMPPPFPPFNKNGNFLIPSPIASRFGAHPTHIMNRFAMAPPLSRMNGRFTMSLPPFNSMGRFRMMGRFGQFGMPLPPPDMMKRFGMSPPQTRGPYGISPTSTPYTMGRFGMPPPLPPMGRFGMPKPPPYIMGRLGMRPPLPQRMGRFGMPPTWPHPMGRFGMPPPPPQIMERLEMPPPPPPTMGRLGMPPLLPHKMGRFGMPPPPPHIMERLEMPPPPPPTMGRFGMPPPPPYTVGRFGMPPTLPHRMGRFRMPLPPPHPMGTFGMSPPSLYTTGKLETDLPPLSNSMVGFSAPPPPYMMRKLQMLLPPSHIKRWGMPPAFEFRSSSPSSFPVPSIARIPFAHPTSSEMKAFEMQDPFMKDNPHHHGPRQPHPIGPPPKFYIQQNGGTHGPPAPPSSNFWNPTASSSVMNLNLNEPDSSFTPEYLPPPPQKGSQLLAPSVPVVSPFDVLKFQGAPSPMGLRLTPNLSPQAVESSFLEAGNDEEISLESHSLLGEPLREDEVIDVAKLFENPDDDSFIKEILADRAEEQAEYDDDPESEPTEIKFVEE